MASGSYMQAAVVCPFYCSDDGHRKIVCEGLVPGTKLHGVFRRKHDYDVQMRTFFAGRCENCELYQALMHKYEEDENP